jgi:hypothetical protein
MKERGSLLGSCFFFMYFLRIGYGFFKKKSQFGTSGQCRLHILSLIFKKISMERGVFFSRFTDDNSNLIIRKISFGYMICACSFAVAMY